MLSETSGLSIQDFSYPLSGLSVRSNWPGIASVDGEKEDLAFSGAQVVEPPLQVSAEDLEAAFENGRREGIEQGRDIERREQAARAAQLAQERIEFVAKLNEHFAVERDSFLRAVEPEIVTLALRVAERILRHEVQVDPLALTGSIRVALSQIADRATVRIHVPADDAQLWSDTLAHLPNLRGRPVLVADAELGAGECKLESTLGSVDLGMRSQLQEMSQQLIGQEVADLDCNAACGQR
jgi:flagellar assembly protein FliH